MHDHFSELYEWDENGIPRRKKRVARDREHIHFPVTVMDAMQARAGFHPTFADGSPDFTNPHRKGFRFADVDDADRLAANEAYEQMRTRLSDAWRNKGQQQDADLDDRTPARTLDALQQDAATAYAERNKRLQNAWRHKDGA